MQTLGFEATLGVAFLLGCQIFYSAVIIHISFSNGLRHSNVVVFELSLSFTFDTEVHEYAKCCWEDLVQLRAKVTSFTAPFQT